MNTILDSSHTALTFAARAGHAEIVKLLLKAGARVNRQATESFRI